jgi:amidophosphoribosyltransferase
MCGIAGVLSDKNEVGPNSECGHGASTALLIMNQLQNRAREMAGIASQSLKGDQTIHLEVGSGLAMEVFTQEKLRLLPGENAIGHLRYATTADRYSGQPFVFSSRFGEFALAHNGNITNVIELESGPLSGVQFKTGIDTERLGELIARAEGLDFVSALHAALPMVKGSYALVILHEGRLIAVRDNSGNRPLYYGCLDGASTDNATWTVASETSGFLSFDVMPKQVNPGEIVIFSGGEPQIQTLQSSPTQRMAKCIFELIYLGYPASTIFGQSVADFRTRVGEALAHIFPVNKADIVAPVPDSANFIAYGFSLASGVKSSPAVLRNHFVGRTFLANNQVLRQHLIRQKFSIIGDLVRGKSVVLVDDSIVRLTTMPIITKALLQAGAREVHVLVGCPPLRHPCNLGVDMPTYTELIAANRSIDEIRGLVNATSLKFLPLEDLELLTGAPKEYCYACFTGNYPS